MSLRKWLGQMELDERVRELLLTENNLETIAFEFCPASAPVSEPLTLYKEPAKRVGELLNLHAGNLSLRRRFGHAATRSPRVRLPLISPVKSRKLSTGRSRPVSTVA